jgi:predicted negative regulator of RcsB-dependent stress response
VVGKNRLLQHKSEKMMITPFDATLTAAELMSNPMAKSLVLAELAEVQVEAGLIDNALANINLIPNLSEKRQVLFRLAFRAVQENKTEHLLRFIRTMVEVDPKSMSSVGRLAQSLLENGNLEKAIELVQVIEKPFDSELNRYNFIAKFIELAENEQLDNAQLFLETFSDKDYRDWGNLALAKRLVLLKQLPEAQTIAESFSFPLRQSWAFFELSRLTAGKNHDVFLHRAGEILETISIEPDLAESLAIQFRILGKTALKTGNTELGLRLLEWSETAASQISVPIQRFRAQYFLAKVLRELGRIHSVQEYLDPAKWKQLEISGLDRSRIGVWAAEAEPANSLTFWSIAVQDAGKPEQKSTDISRSERIVEILRRFNLSNNKLPPSGEPERDAVNLSAEEFEEYYYSPFAIKDCNC